MDAPTTGIQPLRCQALKLPLVSEAKYRPLQAESSASIRLRTSVLIELPLAMWTTPSSSRVMSSSTQSNSTNLGCQDAPRSIHIQVRGYQWKKPLVGDHNMHHPNSIHSMGCMMVLSRLHTHCSAASSCCFSQPLMRNARQMQPTLDYIWIPRNEVCNWTIFADWIAPLLALGFQVL